MWFPPGIDQLEDVKERRKANPRSLAWVTGWRAELELLREACCL